MINPLKKAVSDTAFAPFLQGTEIEGATEGYEVQPTNSHEIVLRVQVPDHPAIARYFVISVREMK